MPESAVAYLETEPLGRLVRKYSVPCTISLLVGALYNIVDQIFIANASYLGSCGNAASTVVFPMTVIALSFSIMIGDGCCTLVSISLGAKKTKDANLAVGNSIIASLVIGLFFSILYFLFMDPILTAFGARVNEETFRMSKEYFFWINLGIPFYLFAHALNSVVRADGSPNFAMVALLVGAICNVVLDPILIYVIPWGMAGAAIATIAGQLASAILVAAYLRKMKATPLSRSSFVIKPKLIGQMAILGASSFLAQISVVLSMAAIINMSVKAGAGDPIFSQPEFAQIPTAVAGIVSKFFMIVISISVGLAAGCIPIAGYNIGAKRYDRVLKLMKILIIGQVIVGLVSSIIFLLFPYQLMLLFGAAKESIHYTNFSIWFIRGQLCLLPLACLDKGMFIFLQSLGKPRESSFLSILREFVLGIGLIILLPMLWGLYALPFFMPVADIITFIAVLYFVIRVRHELKKPVQPLSSDAKEELRINSARTQARTHLVITLGRACGSGGSSVGRLLAKQLNIPYYDSSLLEEAARRSGVSKNLLNSLDEKPQIASLLYRHQGPLAGTYSSWSAQANQAQQEAIEAIANAGPCVIVGRRADQILAGRSNLLRVFVTAPKPARIARLAQREGISERESTEKITIVDRERSAYYNQPSSLRWGEPNTYDLCVDTEHLGIEGAVEVILGAVNTLEKHQPSAS